MAGGKVPRCQDSSCLNRDRATKPYPGCDTPLCNLHLEDVEKLFADNAAPEAKTVFKFMQRKHPGRFQDGRYVYGCGG